MATISDIRNSTVSKLLNATDAANRVFNSKITPNQLSNLPTIIVYTDSVNAVNKANKPSFYYTTDLQIDVIVSAVTNWADAADTIVEQIINTLMIDQDWLDQFQEIEGYTVSYNYINDAVKPLCTAEIKISVGLFKAY